MTFQKGKSINPGFRSKGTDPVADVWVVISALLTGILLSRNRELSILFGIALGSSLVFLGLNALPFLGYTSRFNLNQLNEGK